MNYKVTDFKPLFDNILVKPIVVEERDGFAIAQNYENKPQLGEVIAVGEGRLLDNGELFKPPVKPGDIVLFNQYSANKTELGAELFIKMDDILGKK